MAPCAHPFQAPPGSPPLGGAAAAGELGGSATIEVKLGQQPSSPG